MKYYGHTMHKKMWRKRGKTDYTGHNNENPKERKTKLRTESFNNIESWTGMSGCQLPQCRLLRAGIAGGELFTLQSTLDN